MTIRRILALYDWKEPFNLARNPEALVRFAELSSLKPTKATFLVLPENKERRRTIRNQTELLGVLQSFKNYEWIALDDPEDGNFLRTRFHFTFEVQGKRCVTIKPRSDYSLKLALDQIKYLCAYITPRYGFLHSLEGFAALVFAAGVGTTDVPRELNKRIDDLGRSLRHSKEHLAGKLHDVYGLNVLSPPHLERDIEGTPLGAWIGAGGRGSLETVKPGVYTWIVPDDVRLVVRSTLFRAGALIATV